LAVPLLAAYLDCQCLAVVGTPGNLRPPRSYAAVF